MQKSILILGTLMTTNETETNRYEKRLVNLT